MSKSKTMNNSQSINNNSPNNINDCKNEEIVNNSNITTQISSKKNDKKPKKGKKTKAIDFLDYIKDKGITFKIHYEGEIQKTQSLNPKSTPQTEKELSKINSQQKNLNIRNNSNNSKDNSLDNAISNKSSKLINNIKKININTIDSDSNSTKKQSKKTNIPKKISKKSKVNLKRLKVTPQSKYIFKSFPNKKTLLSKQLYKKYHSISSSQYYDYLYNYQPIIQHNIRNQMISLQYFYGQSHLIFYNYQYQMIMKIIQNKKIEPQHLNSSEPEKPCFYHNHSELIETTTTLSLLEFLFSFDNLNVDFILRKLLDEDGYVSVDILVLKHPQAKKFLLTKEKIEKILVNHRQNEITETVETFDSILIRNRCWNEKPEMILSLDKVYQKQLMLLSKIVMNIKINTMNNYNKMLKISQQSFILNLKPKKVLQHQLKVQAVKSLTLSPLKK